MKYLLILFSCLLFSQEFTGRVGINTNTPGQTLDVNGGLRLGPSVMEASNGDLQNQNGSLQVFQNEWKALNLSNIYLTDTIVEAVFNSYNYKIHYPDVQPKGVLIYFTGQGFTHGNSESMVQDDKDYIQISQNSPVADSNGITSMLNWSCGFINHIQSEYPSLKIGLYGASAGACIIQYYLVNNPVNRIDFSVLLVPLFSLDVETYVEQFTEAGYGTPLNTNGNRNLLYGTSNPTDEQMNALDYWKRNNADMLVVWARLSNSQSWYNKHHPYNVELIMQKANKAISIVTEDLDREQIQKYINYKFN